MAPKFKKNMFYCSAKDNAVTGLIGFDGKMDFLKAVFQFRDKFVQKAASRGEDFFIHKEEGTPTRIDSSTLFFDKQQKTEAEKFFKSKMPNFFHFIFNTQTRKKWSKEWALWCKSAKISLETSHDFPCLVITTSIYSQTELSDMIKSIANELSIEMYENKELEDTRLVMSNHTFDIPKNN